MVSHVDANVWFWVILCILHCTTHYPCRSISQMMSSFSAKVSCLVKRSEMCAAGGDDWDNAVVQWLGSTHLSPLVSPAHVCMPMPMPMPMLMCPCPCPCSCPCPCPCSCSCSCHQLLQSILHAARPQRMRPMLLCHANSTMQHDDSIYSNRCSNTAC